VWSASARVRLVAVLAGLLLVLAACTGSAPPSPTVSAVAPGTTIAWALDQQPTQYNPSSTAESSPVNTAVLSGVLGGFWRYLPNGTVQRDAEFGTIQKISDDPLTVRYTIDRRAVWSDGVPIECDDIALAWLANSGVTGVTGFSSLDVARYREMNRPKCSSGDKVVIVSYRTPFADWETAFGPGSATLLPAHVAEREAGLRGTFADYLDTPASPELAKAIAFWNTGWALTPGTVRGDLLLSSGPYLIASWEAGDSLVLKVNPRWWGRPPGVGTIVVTFLAPQAQAQALGAGKIQAMDPAPDTGILSGLRALGPRARVTVGSRFGFEHLDFNFRGAFRDRSLREAFARCLPRQEIVDKLVKPLNPGATIMESRFVFPFQPGYAAHVAAGRRYDSVDLAGARALLAGRRPTVRIGWRKDPEQLNQGRLDTVAMIKSSCEQAGFKIADTGTPTFLEREWPAGAFDVALLSWTGSPVVTASGDIYTTGGASNLGGYGSAVVDQLSGRLAHELDGQRQSDLLRQIDERLWKDLATIPLYAYPGVTATTQDAVGIVFNPTETDLTWNVAEWARV
jgi:peptide/nickel transport system substrate-binding protein